MGALKPWHFLVLLVCFLIAAAAIGGLVWLIVHLSKKSRSPQPPYPGPPYQGGPPPHPYHQQPPPHSHTGPVYGDAPNWDSGGSADGGGGGDSGGGDGGGGGGGE